MKIAYVNIQAADNRRAWSGIVYYMREALESAGAEVEVIAPLNDRHAQVWRMISAALFGVQDAGCFGNEYRRLLMGLRVRWIGGWPIRKQSGLYHLLRC